MATELFETFQPGQKVIKTLNLAHTHNLSGISKANVEVVQSFSYIVGDAAVPKTLAGMLACEPVASNTVSIEPNQNLAKR